MSDDASTKTTGASLGPVLIGIAAFFLYFSTSFPAAGLDASDPGPRAWPVFLACCLLLAGVGYTAAWGVRVVAARQDGEAAETAPLAARLGRLLADWGVQNVVMILVALVLLIAALPHLGFALSATLFSTVIMTRLGRPGVAAALRRGRPDKEPSLWRQLVVTAAIAVAVSIVLVALIIVLFDRVFDSPLPRGEALGLPF